MLAIIRQLSRVKSQEDIVAAISLGARRFLQADGVTVVLRDGDRCYFAEDDAVSPLWKGRRFSANACIGGWCMTNRRSAAVADIFQDPRVATDAFRPGFVRSLAMVPVGQDEPVAALGAYWSEPHQPLREELDHLQAIADAAALAVTNLQLQQAKAPDRRRAQPPRASKANDPLSGFDHGRFSLRSVVTRLFREGLRPNSPQAYGFAALCVVMATLVRMGAAATGAQGLPTFESYYPAMLLAALIGGSGSAVLAAVLGGIAANYFFMAPANRFVPLSAADIFKIAFYGGSTGLIIYIIGWHKRALLRLKQEDAEHVTLAREQQHRVLNAVFMVETIVRQSLRDNLAQARVINRRIRAGFAHINIDLPTRPIRMLALLNEELAPFDLACFTLDCSNQTLLGPRTSRLIGLAVHELATNALKYGALSTLGGRVKVAAQIVGGQISLSWLESGGPEVQAPQKRGYGSVMLHRLIEAAGGAISVEYRPTGVAAELSLALEPTRRGWSRPPASVAPSPLHPTRKRQGA